MATSALADTPASQVYRQAVGPGQPYPLVAAQSEAWFDLGGFCKIVAVGDLSWANPPAKAVPVLVPGNAAQWSSFRTAAASHYHGQLGLTTCCRPQANIATLCAATDNPTAVSLQYGRLGETDQLGAHCVGPEGDYSESIAVTCVGDNGPDGQAAWQGGTIGEVCASNAQTVTGVCSSAGSGGWGTQSVTIYNSCNQIQSSTHQDCYSQPVCSPNYQKTGCALTAALMHDVNNCPDSADYNLPGGCSAYACNGEAKCYCNILDPQCMTDPPASGCPIYECLTWYSSGDVSGDCYPDEWCINTNQRNSGPTHYTCKHTCYQ